MTEEEIREMVDRFFEELEYAAKTGAEPVKVKVPTKRKLTQREAEQVRDAVKYKGMQKAKEQEAMELDEDDQSR